MDTGSSHWELRVIPPTAQINAQCSTAGSSYVIKDCCVIHVQNIYAGKDSRVWELFSSACQRWVMAAQLLCPSSLITNARSGGTNSRLNSVTSPTHCAPGPHQPQPVEINLGRQEAARTPEITARSERRANKEKSSLGDQSVFIKSIYRQGGEQGCVFVQRYANAMNPRREHLPPVLSLLLSPPDL